MGGFIGIWILVALFLTVVPIIILVKVLTNDEINNESKILWAILLLLGSWVGVIIYFFIADKNVLK